MNIANAIQSQYLAALEMLKQVIVLCPAGQWDAPGNSFRTWNIAYHSLFYVHFYLSATSADFTPWEKHHDPDTGEPFTREEVLEYLAFVQQIVKTAVPRTHMEAPSGFDWLPFDKLELQFYSIRHIQQHVGELFERVGVHNNIALDWVSLVSQQA